MPQVVGYCPPNVSREAVAIVAKQLRRDGMCTTKKATLRAAFVIGLQAGSVGARGQRLCAAIRRGGRQKTIKVKIARRGICVVLGRL